MNSNNVTVKWRIGPKTILMDWARIRILSLVSTIFFASTVANGARLVVKEVAPTVQAVSASTVHQATMPIVIREQ